MILHLNNNVKQVLLVLSLAISYCGFSQNKEVEVSLGEVPNAWYPVIKEIPGKGVLVSYSVIEGKKTYKHSSSMVFYDKDLNKKWELKGFNRYEMKKYYFDNYRNTHFSRKDRGLLEYAECFVSPTGEYAYSVNFVISTIYQINIETGKLVEIPLDKSLDLDKAKIPRYTLSAFVDNENFYLVHGNKYFSSKSLKAKPLIFVSVINHKDKKPNTLSLKPVPPSGNDKPESGIMYTSARQWENFLVLNNILILKDNFTLEDKKSKQFYRKVAYYPLDGSEHAEAYVKMGEKIADEDLMGDIMYDDVHQRIYTYSLNKQSGKLVMTYSCFDLTLKPIWEKHFDPKLGTQILQKTVGKPQLQVNIDNSVTITSSYGLKYYTVHTDVNGDNPEFVIDDKCDQGKLKEDKIYTLNCYEFNILKGIKGFKSYVLKDKGSKDAKNATGAKFIRIGDKVIFARTYSKGLKYKLASFDMPK